MKILISAKQNQIGLKSAKRLEKHLSKFLDLEDIRFDPSTAKKLRRFRKRGTKIKKFDGDMIITLGGDGTFLWTAYQSRVPILPVRTEGHGFLCSIDFKDLLKNLDKIIDGNYMIDEKMRLKCTRIRSGFERYIERIFHKSYPLALNEIAFARKRPSKILETEFTIDGTKFNFSGDGIIFSTPSGSTAYSSSAGGPLIDTSLKVINVVPVCPFFSKIKAMTIPDDKKILVKIKGDCAVIIDGHSGEYLKQGDFIVEKGLPLKTISISDKSFYEKLKSTFLE